MLSRRGGKSFRARLVPYGENAWKLGGSKAGKEIIDETGKRI